MRKQRPVPETEAETIERVKRVTREIRLYSAQHQAFLLKPPKYPSD